MANTALSEYIANFVVKYTEKTKSSKDKALLARANLADSRASAGFRLSTKELVYPIVGVSGGGAYFTDIDGNSYLDIAMGFGCLLFGHYPSFLKETLQEQLSSGIQLGPQSCEIHEVVELLKELTAIERFAFCNTGTEAVMMAFRLARLSTKKNKIVMFTNSYHGSYDGTLGARATDNASAVPLYGGILPAAYEDVLVLEYGELNVLEALYPYSNEIAAILVEPVRSREPSAYSKEFLQLLREACNKFNAILIFDEVITGFRCGVSGAKGLFEIIPDMVIYGKVLASGLPVGVVGGSYQHMAGVDGGTWSYGDNSYPRESTTFFGGTFNKNPLTCSAMKATLLKIKGEGAEIVAKLNRKTAHIADVLNNYFSNNLIPIKVGYFSSLFKFESQYNIDLFFYHLIYSGIYIWEGKTMFLSEAHSDDDVLYLINTVKRVALLLADLDYFPSKKHGAIV